MSDDDAGSSSSVHTRSASRKKMEQLKEQAAQLQRDREEFEREKEQRQRDNSEIQRLREMDEQRRQERDLAHQQEMHRLREEYRLLQEKLQAAYAGVHEISSPSMDLRSGTTPLIPTAGGRVIDHSTKQQPSGAACDETLMETPATVRTARPAASVTSQGSRRELLRLRAELEAEQEIAKIKENLIRKKLAVTEAELEVQEEEKDLDPVDTAGRVEDWLEKSPVMPQVRLSDDVLSGRRAPPGTPATEPADGGYPTTPRRGVSFEDERPASRPTSSRREASSDRLRAIEDLTAAISTIAKPRPIPRQTYELPKFGGDPAEWLAFKKMYANTSKEYKFKNFENLARLQVALSGEAKTAVEDLLRTCDDPEAIITALEEEFGHPNLILDSALKKVKNLPKVSDSGKELRKFTAAVRNCVSLLKNISAEGYVNNPQLVNELLNKLTPIQRAQYGEFAMRLDSEKKMDLRVSPNLEVLVDFLSHLTRASSYYAPVNATAGPAVPVKPAPPARTREYKGTTTVAPKIVHRVNTQVSDSSEENKSAQSVGCQLCKNDHKLYQCDKFKDMSVSERWDFVKDNKLCFKCIVRRHSRQMCRAKRCDKCNYGHNTLLHVDKSESETPTTNAEAVTNVGANRSKALLKIIPVTLISDNGDVQNVFALLDDGATVSLLDDKFASALDGPVLPLKIISARGQTATDNKSRKVKIVIRGPNGINHKVSVRTINNIDLPVQSIPDQVISDNVHLNNLDCSAMEDAKPMLLLGQDNWELIVGRDVRKGKSGQPVASLTKLGWVIHGPLGTRDPTSANVNCMTNIHDLVKEQFELEAIGISEISRKNDESERATKILENTSRRIEGGWEVGLLWNRENIELPDNYADAHKRLMGIERKMDRDPTYAEAYVKQVDRLISEGYAEKVDSLSANPIWYLPHFGVVNPNKPGKLRLVYDAAATYKGVSLNDNLLSGPDMLNSLLGVLLKFRAGPIAYTADIADMFLRVKIRKEDQGAQLFLWRGQDRNRDPDIYCMRSMIFGAASSPTSAIYILNKNANEFQHQYPNAVNAIQEKHYMDDYLDSVESVEQAQALIEQVSEIHAAGGFVIRGWVTNAPELRDSLSSAVPDRVTLDKSPDSTERTLGMIWTPGSDNLAFDLSFKRLPSELVEGKVTPTKREFLRFIMSIFDPLGFLYPCVIQSRILMQKIWKSGIQWDEKLHDAEAEIWFKWLDNLKLLTEVQVPRWYGLLHQDLELHVFGDASEQAYAAVAYIVGHDGNGDRKVAMVAGKARVAPVKVVSIPRLELQAAVLVCRLAKTVEKELGIPISRRFLWTDSKTVLKWINSDARDFQRFVSHRLAEIDRKSEISDWRWVPTADNPADEATRLDWPNTKCMWLSGPSFLCDPQQQWPANEDNMVAEEDLERVHVTREMEAPLFDPTRYSTWTRAVRVVARVLAFINRCRGKQDEALTASNLQDAEQRLIKQSQMQSFREEIEALKKGDGLPSTSKLRSLDPILFEDGLLRVRGRLSAASELTFGERHPIILDGHNNIARLVVLDYHTRALHENHESVVNSVREKYWITKLRPTVKSVIARCQTCKVRRAQPSPPKMGDLPPERLMSTRRAFVHCGLDYFGPMEVTIGRRREKRWGVLFTCLATRAVHLELAASLSADSAIMALRRLIARRGHPAVIFSDRGTNFVGANTELRAALREMDQGRVRDEALTKGIEWRFNPPSAPHMGGCWERLVRSVKNALRATLKERAPREEILHTLLLEAELVVNSRPLTYVPADHNEPVVLTPNHLLLGTAAGDAPMTSRYPRDVDARQQWRRVNALADMFWKRWTREYLPTLQRRQKWTQCSQPVKVGDIAVIVDGNQPRNMWPRGVVIKVYRGNDNQIRVVDVKTAHGILKRPVVKIAVLPTDSDVIG